MKIEVRNLGLSNGDELQVVAMRALRFGLDQFAERVGQVRVRFTADGPRDATCRVRAWCSEGPTVIIESHARSGDEAVRNAAEALSRALTRRFDGPRTSRRPRLPGAFRRLTLEDQP